MSEQERHILSTVPEVATMLSIAESTLYRQVKQGSFPATKIGRFWRVSALDIARHIGADPAELSAILEEKPTQERTASTTVPERLPSTTNEPMFTVQATSSNGRATERANLTAEQPTAFAAWLMVDPDTRPYTVEKEP